MQAQLTELDRIELLGSAVGDALIDPCPIRQAQVLGACGLGRKNSDQNAGETQNPADHDCLPTRVIPNLRNPSPIEANQGKKHENNQEGRNRQRPVCEIRTDPLGPSVEDKKRQSERRKQECAYHRVDHLDVPETPE